MDSKEPPCPIKGKKWRRASRRGRPAIALFNHRSVLVKQIGRYFAIVRAANCAS